MNRKKSVYLREGQRYTLHTLKTSLDSYSGLDKHPEAEFWDKIQTIVLKSFPLCYSQSPPQLCLEISVSSNSRNLLQFLQFSFQLLWIKDKGGKSDRKPYPLPYGERKNPHKNPKSENSQHYAQKPQRNCTFMISATGLKPLNHLMTQSYIYSSVSSLSRDLIADCTQFTGHIKQENTAKEDSAVCVNLSL